jgi:hypothetical protein
VRVLISLATTLRLNGKLRESEAAGQQALLLARTQGSATSEVLSLAELGQSLSVRGQTDVAAETLDRALQLGTVQQDSHGLDRTYAGLVRMACQLGEAADARARADGAWELAQAERFVGDLIRAARLQGQAALAMNDLSRAEERFQYAQTQAEAVNFMEEELAALVGLAELRRRQKDWLAVRDLVEAVGASAERGPYPLAHAAACNILAQMERDAGNREGAIQAARQAYRLSWCDGPPFAYQWGLDVARAHLTALDDTAVGVDLIVYEDSHLESAPQVESESPAGVLGWMPWGRRRLDRL